ncbi:head maturation protease, ClpP-related [Paenibacillus sp. FJAT-26967]|uniref:head maturation protease, ClpP-related n=1 Tax=Paenibacillus sp. FJAT-26967 TaxID=1729690 RepID=UPI000838568B|nr:head maturation protease, ClpP-related [Paenibacillus sp. FJAT-26967]
MKKTNNFWQFNSLSPSEGELILYGDIRSEKPWWSEGDDGVYPRQFSSDLNSLGDVAKITVRVNSRGGDVSAATAIYTRLKSHAAVVTIIVEGMAASAATIIMMAGDVVKAPAAAQVMIHDPLLMLYGMYNAEDMDKMKAILETSKNSIMNAYINKTGRDREELSAMMTQEKWMTAEEAKGEGFVDEILFEEKVEASLTNDNRFMVVNSVAHDMTQFSSRPDLNKSPAVSFPTIPLLSNKSKERVPTLEIKNIDDFKTAYPDIFNQVVAAAKKDERERMKSIDEISNSIADELVASAKYDEPMSAAELALKAMKADGNNGIKHLENRQRELQNNAHINPESNKTKDDLQKEQEAQNIDLIAAAANAGRGTEAR